MSAAGGETQIRVLLIDGSPSGAGRTATVLRGVGASAADAGAETQQVSLAGDLESVAAEVISIAGEFDAFVFGTPTYRASYTGELKFLLDRMPRGMWGEISAPLQAKPVGLVVTGASLHHFLAAGSLRDILMAFFSALVIPPGLYVPHDGFSEDGVLLDEWSEAAELQGKALVELALALRASPALRALGPQA